MVCEISYPITRMLIYIVLSKGIDNQTSTFAPIRALRQVQHERLKKELFELDKDARLRSGTRGMAARKALVAFEKKIAEFTELYLPPSPFQKFV